MALTACRPYRHLPRFLATVSAATAAAFPSHAAAPSPQQAAAPQAQFQALPYGSVRPAGWIKRQLDDDVRAGILAYYHRSWQVGNKGFLLRGKNPNRVAKQPDFWDGGAEGYWALGLICSAILTEDATARQRADALVAEILQSQDSDGYIGIFDASSRYRPDTVDRDVHRGFLFFALLSYAQAYRRPDVLSAVERAVQCDMRHFNRETKGLWAKDFTVMSNPWFLDHLAQATGNRAYADYAAFLVENYSTAPGGNRVFADCTLPNLLEREKPFIGHACNTTGNLALPWIAYYANGDPRYRQAGENAFEKFARQMSVSGSLPGDEDNQGRPPFPDISIEFCTTTYLVENALLVAAKTGRSLYFDYAERALFNAGMGARLPDGTAHAYLKRDNEFNLEFPGIFHRYQYSPDHHPFCCTTRMMSVLPVYVGNMFARTSDGQGIAAVGFGPAIVRTEIKGTPVTVEEKTLYPFDGRIEFTLRPERPVRFEFLVRVPTWASTADLDSAGAAIARRGEYFVVTKEWTPGDRVVATFSTPVTTHRWINGETYIQSGPLVFAAKIPAIPTKYDRFPSGVTIQEFSDGKLPIYGFSPGQNASLLWEASFDGVTAEPAYGFKRVSVKTADPDRPWHESPVRLAGQMNRMRRKFEVELVPMGCTVLRRVTFPVGHVYNQRVDKLEGMLDSRTSL